MRIAVLGTGAVGLTLADRLAELGHEVVVGTRDVEATLERGQGRGAGGEGVPIGDWLAQHDGIPLVRFDEAGQHGELFVNATHGAGSLPALASVGRRQLAGRVLVDVANPLDFRGGFPPTLWVKDTDSLGEQIQRSFPETLVVKTLNTVTAEVMADPGLVPSGDSSVFLSGDDTAAKDLVRGLLASFGWRDIIDLGGIETARGVEMYLPLWLRLMGSLGTGVFNISVRR